MKCYSHVTLTSSARCLGARRASPNTSSQPSEESWGKFFENFVASQTLHASFLWSPFAVICGSFLSTQTVPFLLDHLQPLSHSKLPHILAHSPLCPNLNACPLWVSQVEVLHLSLTGYQVGRWGRSFPGSSCFFQTILHPLGFWDTYNVTMPLSKSPHLCQLPACWSLSLSQWLPIVSSPLQSCHHPMSLTTSVDNKPFLTSQVVHLLFSCHLCPHSPPRAHSMALLWNLFLFQPHHLWHLIFTRSTNHVLPSTQLLPRHLLVNFKGAFLTWSTNFSLYYISSLLSSLFYLAYILWSITLASLARILNIFVPSLPLNPCAQTLFLVGYNFRLCFHLDSWALLEKITLLVRPQIHDV